MICQKNYFLKISVLLFFVLGLGIQGAHRPHFFEASALSSSSIIEFCGGAEKPCSRPDHDHPKKHAHHCVVCQITQTHFFAEKSERGSSFSLNLLGQLVTQEEDFRSSFFATQLGSRAPPLNS
jgi:hypothetical protein